MAEAPQNEDEPITLAQYAAIVGRSVRSIQMDVKAKRIPAWRDPTIVRSKVTSLGAIRRVREAAAKKAEETFKQKAKLG